MNLQTRRTPDVAFPSDWWRPTRHEAAVRPAPVEVRTERGGAAFAALVAYSIVLIAAPQGFFPALQPLRIALLAAGIAILFHLRDRWSRAVIVSHSPAVAIALALLVWAVVTIPFSYWPGGSAGVVVDMFAKSIAVFLLLAGAITSMARLRVICWTVAGCATIIAVYALLNYATGTMFGNATDRIAGYGTSGLAGNPNDLALLLNLFIPIIGALAVISRSVGAKVAASAALVLAVAATVATFSRAGFLTLAAIAVMHLWSLVRRGAIGWALAVVLAGAVTLLVAPPAYLERLSTVVDITADQTGSAQGRWRDMVAAAGFVARHPLIGAGIGMDVLALNELRGPVWLSVHNVYLNYAVDLGLVGLGLFLALFAATLAGVYHVESRADTPDALRTMARALRFSLVAFAIAGFFHPVAYHAFFYYVAGMAVAVRRIAGRRRQSAPAGGRSA